MRAEWVGLRKAGRRAAAGISQRQKLRRKWRVGNQNFSDAPILRHATAAASALWASSQDPRLQPLLSAPGTCFAASCCCCCCLAGFLPGPPPLLLGPHTFGESCCCCCCLAGLLPGPPPLLLGPHTFWGELLLLLLCRPLLGTPACSRSYLIWWWPISLWSCSASSTRPQASTVHVHALGDKRSLLSWGVASIETAPNRSLFLCAPAHSQMPCSIPTVPRGPATLHERSVAQTLRHAVFLLSL
jgi:hypothetical protein